MRDLNGVAMLRILFRGVHRLCSCGVALWLVVGAGGRACGIVRIVSSKKGKVVASHVSK